MGEALAPILYLKPYQKERGTELLNKGAEMTDLQSDQVSAMHMWLTLYMFEFRANTQSST